MIITVRVLSLTTTIFIWFKSFPPRNGGIRRIYAKDIKLSTECIIRQLRLKCCTPSLLWHWHWHWHSLPSLPGGSGCSQQRFKGNHLHKKFSIRAQHWQRGTRFMNGWHRKQSNQKAFGLTFNASSLQSYSVVHKKTTRRSRPSTSTISTSTTQIGINLCLTTDNPELL